MGLVLRQWKLLRIVENLREKSLTQDELPRFHMLVVFKGSKSYISTHESYKLELHLKLCVATRIHESHHDSKSNVCI